MPSGLYKIKCKKYQNSGVRNRCNFVICPYSGDIVNYYCDCDRKGNVRLTWTQYILYKHKFI